MDEAVIESPSGDPAARSSIRAVDRALDILDVLARADAGISLVDVAKAIGLPKSLEFRYLLTLERRGHVIRTGDDIFKLGAVRGSSDPLHSSALGKVIASSLGHEEIRSVLAVEGMPALTPRTITSPEGFLHELAIVRAQGYAVDEGENEEGGRCVAVALPYPFGAAMSLSALAARLPKEQLPEVAVILKRADDDIAQEVRNAGP